MVLHTLQLLAKSPQINFRREIAPINETPPPAVPGSGVSLLSNYFIYSRNAWIMIALAVVPCSFAFACTSCQRSESTRIERNGVIEPRTQSLNPNTSQETGR